MYHCSIFDLDGTLLDTIHALAYTTNRVLERLGLGTVDEEHLKHFVGDGYRKQMERCLAYAGDPEGRLLEKSLPIYMEEFAKYCLYQVKPYDGIMEMADFLKTRGVKLAVLSNKPHARTVETIESIFGKGYFDGIAGEREGVPKKPDPTGVFVLAEELQVELSECLYFGDTNTDMRTGINAGVDTVGVLWGFRDRKELEEFHPSYLISHPSEVKRIFGENV